MRVEVEEEIGKCLIQNKVGKWLDGKHREMATRMPQKLKIRVEAEEQSGKSLIQNKVGKWFDGEDREMEKRIRRK